MALRVAHIITGLPAGGAETALYRLLSHMSLQDFPAEVYSLTDRGLFGDRIEGLGVPVRALDMSLRRPNPLTVFRLSGWLRRFRPQVVQTWMYHADLIGSIAAKLAGDIPVIWGIRHSKLDPVSTKRTTLAVARACARLSRWLPTRIACNSAASIESHAAMGYAREKMRLITNGFDLQQFKPNPAARIAMRAELGVPASATLSGMVARFHPVKDFAGFVEAAGIVSRNDPEARFVLCGENVTQSNTDLLRWIMSAGIADKCHILGEQDNVPSVMAGLDVLVSASRSEGFPNVIAEAMACGVPCVVTDVGDSALIVGEAGLVVQPNDPGALASAWLRMLARSPDVRQCLGSAARSRIENRFSISVVAEQYAELFCSVARCLEPEPQQA